MPYKLAVSDFVSQGGSENKTKTVNLEYFKI